MLIRVVLILFLGASANALADAGAGEFMGYRLGAQYPPGPAPSQSVTTTGNLVIVAAQPVKPADIAEVALLTTPVTRTIGSITASQWFATEEEARNFARRYFELLRARYPAWPYGGEVMDARMNVVEVGFSRSPHNLRLRLSEDRRDGRPMWRFSMVLGWLPDSAEGAAWNAASAREQATMKNAERQQLLERSDLRGL